MKNAGVDEKCIIVGDLSIIRNRSEKRGGIFGRDPFQTYLEELFANWDLLDIPPQCGTFTWTNMRVGLGHIDARLDQFLVHGSFIHRKSTIKYFILPSLISDHNPIISSLFISNPFQIWPPSLSF
jgi:hypothetical protein